MMEGPLSPPTDTTKVPDSPTSGDFVPRETGANQGIDYHEIDAVHREPDESSTSTEDLDAREGANAIGRPNTLAEVDGSRPADEQTALSGVSQLYWFERDSDQKIERYKHDGKDPHDLFDPSKPDYLGTAQALLPYFGTGVAAAAAKFHAEQAARVSGAIGASEDDADHDFSPIPVHSDDSTTAPSRPPWFPVRPATREWEEQFIRGMQGLIHALRGKFGRSRNDEDNDFCYERNEDEVARCLARNRDPAHRPFTRGCIDRAAARRDLCIRNGGRPDPDEPLEWSDRDENTGINPYR